MGKHYRPDVWDDPDAEDSSGGSATCKSCGATDLEWVDTGGNPPRQRLYDGKNLHQCPSCADDFDKLD
jgi:hypothetical protein